MNDFTKDELSTINYLIDSYCIYGLPIQGVYKELKTKISSMIDNYCEHKKDGKVYDGLLGLSFKCLKCERFIC